MIGWRLLTCSGRSNGTVEVLGGTTLVHWMGVLLRNGAHLLACPRDQSLASCEDDRWRPGLSRPARTNRFSFVLIATRYDAEVGTISFSLSSLKSTAAGQPEADCARNEVAVFPRRKTPLQVSKMSSPHRPMHPPVDSGGPFPTAVYFTLNLCRVLSPRRERLRPFPITKRK